jgi:hypothetical protein
MASRSFIDIPVIMDEYAEACEENYEFEDWQILDSVIY